jgi:hypothetical protein
MALPPTTGGRKAKHYILAALTAILAAAVVVTVFFVVLSPARIYFSVTNAISHQEKDGGVVLAFTLAANNTSQRAAVKYQSLFVDVSNNTDSAMWIPAKMNTEKSRWHPHGSVATVDGTASLLGGPWATAFFGGDNMAGGAASLVVLVTAAARFKVAGIRTRLYDITVRCGPVTFVRQSRAASSSAAPPVDCSPA